MRKRKMVAPEQQQKQQQYVSGDVGSSVAGGMVGATSTMAPKTSVSAETITTTNTTNTTNTKTKTNTNAVKESSSLHKSNNSILKTSLDQLNGSQKNIKTLKQSLSHLSLSMKLASKKGEWISYALILDDNGVMILFFCFSPLCFFVGSYKLFSSVDPTLQKPYADCTPEELALFSELALRRLNSLFKQHDLKPLPMDTVKSVQLACGFSPSSGSGSGSGGGGGGVASKKKWWSPALMIWNGIGKKDKEKDFKEMTG